MKLFILFAVITSLSIMSSIEKSDSIKSEKYDSKIKACNLLYPNNIEQKSYCINN